MNDFLKVTEYLFSNYKQKMIKTQIEYKSECFIITIATLEKPNCRIVIFKDKYQTRVFGKYAKIQKKIEDLTEELDYYFS